MISDNTNTSFMNKKQDFKNQAKKLAHEGKIVAAKANVENHKKTLKEAEEDYTKASANDSGLVTFPEEGTEVARTRTLVEQAKIDLAQAEEKVKELEKEKVEPEEQPVLSNTPVSTQPEGGEPVSSKQTV